MFAPAPVNDTARLRVCRCIGRRVNRMIDAGHGQRDQHDCAGTYTTWRAGRRVRQSRAQPTRCAGITSRAVLTSKDKPNRNKKTDGKRQPARQPATKAAAYRRPQVRYTDEQRKAAEERARRQLEERKMNRAQRGSQSRWRLSQRPGRAVDARDGRRPAPPAATSALWSMRQGALKPCPDCDVAQKWRVKAISAFSSQQRGHAQTDVFELQDRIQR